MDFDLIERILELMRQHDLSEFELEQEGLKLKVRKTSTGFTTVSPPAANPGLMAAPPPAVAAAATPLAARLHRAAWP